MSQSQTQSPASSPLTDFARILRVIFKLLRLFSCLSIAVAALVVGRELAAVFTFLASIQPVLGWCFLAVCGLALWWFPGRAALRYWRVPPALQQPRLVPRKQAGVLEVLQRLDFVLICLKGLESNPKLVAQSDEVRRAGEEGHALRARLVDMTDVSLAEGEVARFEKRHVDVFMRPLDEEAARVIRQEALAVGVGTAVSMNGTLDAFIVLWRNANLVARIATIYYGRPGLRGSLLILRDVSMAMLIATQVQGLMQTMGGVFGGWFGKAGSVLAGAAGDGAFNALTTVRIGYVARARCRSLRPWNESTLPDILRTVMKEVAVQGAGVVRDVLSSVVKGGLIKLPAELSKRVGDLLSGLLRREQPDPERG